MGQGSNYGYFLLYLVSRDSLRFQTRLLKGGIDSEGDGTPQAPL